MREVLNIKIKWVPRLRGPETWSHLVGEFVDEQRAVRGGGGLLLLAAAARQLHARLALNQLVYGLAHGDGEN